MHPTVSGATRDVLHTSLEQHNPVKHQTCTVDQKQILSVIHKLMQNGTKKLTVALALTL